MSQSPPTIAPWRIYLRSPTSAGVGLIFVVGVLSCFAAAKAQSSPLEEAREVLFRALVAEPVRLTPPWVRHLFAFIAEPRSTVATTESTTETSAELTAPVQRRRNTAAPRAVDEIDPYVTAPAPESASPLAAASMQNEAGAPIATTSARPPSATRATLDPMDPYFGAMPEPYQTDTTETTDMRRGLTATRVEAENPYF